MKECINNGLPEGYSWDFYKSMGEYKEVDLNNIEQDTCIYAIYNNISNKFYIGSTSNLKNRLISHLKDLRLNKHYNKYLQHSYNKNGINSFRFFIVEKVNNLNIIYEREQYYLDLVFKNNKVNIYNMSSNAKGGVVDENCRAIISFSINGNLINTYKKISDAEKDLKISYYSIRGCCRGLQKRVKSYVFFYADDTKRIDSFKNNPYFWLQSGQIGKKRKKVSEKAVGKKWSKESILKNKDSKSYNIYIEVYDFANREFITSYNSIRKASVGLSISNFILRKNINSEVFVVNNYLIRFNKIKKDILPKCYNYRPLKPGLYIETDIDQEMKVITNFKILSNSNLGKSHMKFNGELIRLEIGAFLNHSLNPNCIITDIGQLDKPYYYLVSIRDIEAGEELTVDYYKSACANDVLFKLK